MRRSDTGICREIFSSISISKIYVRNPEKNRPASRVTVAFAAMILVAIAALQLGCGGYSSSASSSGSGTTPTVPPTPVSANFPTFSHVFLVVEENHSFSEVVGNSSMPYFNSLVSKYGLAKQYFANAHPSLPNYLMLTTGQIETFDDNFSGTIKDDNVVRELINAGKSWKAYEESIPSAGYLGGDAPPYVRRHNPFILLSDVQGNPAQAANIVPFSQFATDLVNNSLPQYSFIAPNVDNDAHNGTLEAADSWLKKKIDPLITSSTFQNGGLLIITFDEAENTDVDHGGGQVPTLIISSNSKPNFQSQTLYQHQSTLRLILEALGVGKFPGQSGDAPEMTEFFNGH
jgi:hypothetical protein